MKENMSDALIRHATKAMSYSRQSEEWIRPCVVQLVVSCPDCRLSLLVSNDWHGIPEFLRTAAEGSPRHLKPMARHP